ncbi:MAG: hypothetical protein N2448_10790 [Caloramator sp.]|nr:hypothetical protein [Caloramator sp.]
MKILIKAQGLNFRIPIYIPMAFVNLVINGYIRNKSMNKENTKYIEAIDFNMLSQSLNLLEEYKGLKIVEIQSSDGTKVEICL